MSGRDLSSHSVSHGNCSVQGGPIACNNRDIARVPELVQILRNPAVGIDPILLDILRHPYDGPFWDKRKVNYNAIQVPAYIGACWGMYGLHLPRALRSWENLNVPKKMLIGPPTYLDRPLYQLQLIPWRFLGILFPLCL
jgi:hypothetical protein